MAAKMVTIEEIHYIAKLAKLKITEEEAISFEKELNNILKVFDAVNEDVDVSVDVHNKNNYDFLILRKDEVVAFKNQDELFKNAKKKKNNYLTLPKVIKQEESQ